MKKVNSADVLADPEIQRHTERILVLREEERQTRKKLGSIIAAIGAELVAVKEALDRLSDKTAWLRWLKGHVHYSAKTAQNYMSVARFAEKTKALSFFLELEPTVLYRIAALPDEIAATLTPDTLLTDPQTGRQVPLKDLSTRSLDRALDALEGKKEPDKPKPASVDITFRGATREEYAAEVLKAMDLLTGRLAEIRGRKGRLTGDSKQDVLAAIERLRRTVLKWPAWATPSVAKSRAARR
jgi:hypothetical protein